MAKLRFIVSCFWLCLARTVVSEDLYHKVGGEVLLKPDKSTVPGPMPNILWKNGENKVAEWDKDFGLDIYDVFKERTTLDLTTGELKIIGLTKTDSGVYSVEFNGKLLDNTYKLSVIKAVPKPTITSSCNSNKTSCTLTCEGDTTDAEPVTYSWKVGEGAWEISVKQMNVFKSDTGNSNNGYKYICKLNNAVSGEGEVSEPVGEVFVSEPSEVGVGAVVAGVVVVILVLVAVVIIVWLVWKKKKGYPEDTWIDFLTKFCGGVFAKPSDGNNQTTAKVSDGVQPEQEVTVPLTDINITGQDDADEAGKGQENGAKGSDGVQPEQGVKVPQTANPKTGEDDADKAGKGQGNGAAEASRSDSPKEKSEPDGSDVVQPEQGVTVPQTANPKTGEDDADKVEKGQEKGGAEASGSGSPKEKSEPEGSDVVQPEQVVTVPLTANPKTGEDDADKAEKGQEKGADEPSGSNSPKDESKPEETTPLMEYEDRL
ncbi:uncharacterized protein LOC121558595 isoform X2 [Coregonus clupeaformis]|uniref:uncharacterized protein LOC121558595 isoform X2 n=1 Tax=Coregonus clupeaformis TaxID=59861 RepID=UPI001E1C405D|nr:uncharacterized protein LOC121558595 isoform X2 [Coregonus clupeaformis]